jgi:hypothetical protein
MFMRLVDADVKMKRETQRMIAPNTWKCSDKC